MANNGLVKFCGGTLASKDVQGLRAKVKPCTPLSYRVGIDGITDVSGSLAKMPLQMTQPARLSGHPTETL